MTIGPEPMMRILLMSVRLGIFSFVKSSHARSVRRRALKHALDTELNRFLKRATPYQLEPPAFERTPCPRPNPSMSTIPPVRSPGRPPAMRLSPDASQERRGFQ